MKVYVVSANWPNTDCYGNNIVIKRCFRDLDVAKRFCEQEMQDLGPEGPTKWAEFKGGALMLYCADKAKDWSLPTMDIDVLELN